MLVLSRKRQEAVMIGNNVRVTVLSVKGKRVHLGFEVPGELPVHRQELVDAFTDEERAARPNAVAVHNAS